MYDQFSTTYRALAADRPHRRLMALVAASTLLGIWFVWLVVAKVGVYVVSDNAVIQSISPTLAIESPVPGLVQRVNVSLGDRVAEGQVMVELDDRTLQHLRSKAQAQLTLAQRQLQPAKARLAALRVSLQAATQAGSNTRAVAETDRQEAQVRSKQAAIALRRVEALHKEQLESKEALERARLAMEEASASVTRTELNTARVSEMDKLVQTERIADIRNAEQEVERIVGEIASAKQAVAEAKHDIELRRVRAPAPGTVGEMPRLEIGSYLAQGDHIATIVSTGELKLVAFFAPQQSVGRLEADQIGRLRLDGFSWLQFGTATVRVQRVASETREGEIEVWLTFDKQDFDIPLRHSMPGSVEVEVEQISPLELMLRSAGQMMRSPPNANKAQAETKS